MTMQRFQSIVLRLGNQGFVRHYYWLNYPNDPQLMGIQFPADINGMLAKELADAGFVWNEGLKVWTVERTEP